VIDNDYEYYDNDRKCGQKLRKKSILAFFSKNYLKVYFDNPARRGWLFLKTNIIVVFPHL